MHESELWKENFQIEYLAMHDVKMDILFSLKV